MKNTTKKVTVRHFKTLQGDKWFAPDCWNEIVDDLVKRGYEVSNVKLEKHWCGYEYPEANLSRDQDYAIISYDLTYDIQIDG